MIDMEKVISDLRYLKSFGRVSNNPHITEIAEDTLALLKEQEAEIRQLRLALNISKETCKGIKSGCGQFSDMPTLQPAT